MEEAKRYNNGKIRMNLIPAFSLEQIAKVFTQGAEKYGDNNYRKGMKWSKCMASLKRHILAFDKGEDFDTESKLYHMAHVATNAMFLLEYYKIAPQYDDRPHLTSPKPKIGLDIDEVICDWVGAWMKVWDIKTPTSWFFDYEITSRFARMKKEGILDSFYLNLQPKVDPLSIPFEPWCYVTSRPIDTKITMQWLEKHGFPLRPVVTVGVGESKLEVIKKAGIDIFVDDRYDTFQELNANGVCCYLMDAAHNARYEVGYRRIKSLSELKF